MRRAGLFILALFALSACDDASSDQASPTASPWERPGATSVTRALRTRSRRHRPPSTTGRPTRSSRAAEARSGPLSAGNGFERIDEPRQQLAGVALRTDAEVFVHRPRARFELTDGQMSLPDAAEADHQVPVQRLVAGLPEKSAPASICCPIRIKCSTNSVTRRTPNHRTIVLAISLPTR